MRSPEITIIGTGGLGQALAKALQEANFKIKSIFNRTGAKANNLAADLDISISGTFAQNIDQLGELIFIAVSDESIAEVAHRLATLGDDFSGRIVVHCSGNESAELLENVEEQGALTASFHPLQTFTAQSPVSDFQHIFFSLQGDNAAFSKLRQIAQALGAKTIEVTAGQKSHLHAAAVMASNYLNTLLNAAVDMASVDGLDVEVIKKALLPLVKTTLQNIEHQPFEDVLSGPIKRGDLQTVKSHLELLKGQPDLHRLYRVLGERTVEMARKSQKIDEETARKMFELLE